MTIHTNQQLAEIIELLIKEKGIKKTWLAEKLGVANQNVNKQLHKKNMSLDEVNKILGLLDYSAVMVIEENK